jgi:hypothetical protein
MIYLSWLSVKNIKIKFIGIYECAIAGLIADSAKKGGLIWQKRKGKLLYAALQLNI